MSDCLEIIGKGSLIQHGSSNDRIYLLKLDVRDAEDIVETLLELADRENYSKVFCKVPKPYASFFLSEGFVLEAYIPGFYNGKVDVFFMSKFLTAERHEITEKEQLRNLPKLLSGDYREGTRLKKETLTYTVRKLGFDDIEQMIAIYKMIFATYPFPIHNPEYIKKTMDEDVQYFGAEINGRLAALSSAEIDFKAGNAEMTDFATHKDYTGKGLANLLLQEMEKDMKKQQLNTLYTIARLNSIPMNVTFLKNGYRYSGTLINNTNISGKIESMNIYYKQL